MSINYDHNIDDIERKLISRSYKALLSPKSSTQRKIMAVEYLSQFLHIEEHYKHMSKLYNEEKDIFVIEVMKKALNGAKLYKKYSYLSELFEEEAKGFNEEWDQAVLEMKKQDTDKFNEEFKWRVRAIK